MNKTPIIYTYESWANSQLSIVRHTGGMKINGVFYMLISEHSNRYTPDLLRYDWVPVYTKLGREKTIGLIKNGTTLSVAKQIIKSMGKPKEEQLKLNL
ncbi:MAG: hypothetical protein J6U51_09025 [Bacteroidales bacterium]|nr:hypothetical protein [Bacteroidales bacterium]